LLLPAVEKPGRWCCGATQLEALLAAAFPVAELPVPPLEDWRAVRGRGLVVDLVRTSWAAIWERRWLEKVARGVRGRAVVRVVRRRRVREGEIVSILVELGWWELVRFTGGFG